MHVEPTPARLEPYLAQWDYFAGVLAQRLVGLTDEEYLWRPVESTVNTELIYHASEVWLMRDLYAATPPGLLSRAAPSAG